MTENETTFGALVARLRQGDEDAARELVERYEAEVRRFIRFRLSSPGVRRVVDSIDVCQSVLGKFFVQIQEGHLDVDSPEKLRALLLTMARHKLFDHVRRQHAARRDARRAEPGGAMALERVADQGESPSEQLAGDEVVVALQQRLSDRDRYLVEQRMADRPWGDLATELDSSAEALRKRMSRALDKAARELGIIGQDHDP